MLTSPTTFPVAARDFFGLLPGQTTGQFIDELKALSVADKDEMRSQLVAVGYVLKPLGVANAA